MKRTVNRILCIFLSVLMSVAAFSAATFTVASGIEVTEPADTVTNRALVTRWTAEGINSATYTNGVHATYGTEIDGLIDSGGSSLDPGRNVTEADTVLGYGFGAVIQNCVFHSVSVPFDSVTPNVGDTYTVKVKANVTLRGGNSKNLASHANTDTENVVGIQLNGGTTWWTGEQYDALPTYTDSVYGYEYKILETTYTRTEADTGSDQVRMLNVNNGFVSYAFAYGVDVYADDGSLCVSKNAQDMYNTNGIGVMGGDWAGAWVINAGNIFYASAAGEATSQAGCDGSVNNMWGLYYTFAEQGYYELQYVMKFDNIEGGNLATITANIPAEAGNFATHTITADEVTAGVGEGYFGVYTLPFKFTGQGDSRVEPCMALFDNADVSLVEIRLVKVSAVDHAKEAIDGIGTVTAESGDAISAARTEYNALSEADQALVTNYSVLTTAEATYASIQAASEVIDYIDAIGTVTKDSAAAIEAARTAYDALSAEDKALVTNYKTLTDAEAAYQDILYPEIVSENQTEAHWGMDKLKGISSSAGLLGTYGSEVTGIIASGGDSWNPGRNIDTNTDTVLGYGYGAVIVNYVVYGADIPMSLAAPNEGDTFTVKAKVNVLLRPSAGDLSTHGNTAGSANVIGMQLDPAAADKIWWTGDSYDALPTYVDSQYGYEYKVIETTLTNTEAVGENVQFRLVNVSNGFVTYAFCYGFEVYNDQTGEMVYSKTGSDLYNKNGCGVMGGDWAGSWYVNSGLQFYKSSEGQATSQAGCDGSANNLWGLYYTPSEHGLYAMEYVMKIDNMDAGENVVHIGVNSPAEGTIAGTNKVINASDVEAAGTEGRFAIYTTGIFNYTGSGDGRVEPIVGFYDNASISLTDIRLVKVSAANEVEYYIDAIGTVTKDSAAAIEAARTAYDALSAEDKALVTNYKTLTDAEAAYQDILYPEIVSENQTEAHWGMDKLKGISSSAGLLGTYGSEVTGIIASGGDSWNPGRNIDTNTDTVLGYGYGAVIENCVVYGASIPMALAAPNEGDTFTVKAKVNVLLRPSAGGMSTHGNTAGSTNVIGLNLSPASADRVWWTGDSYDALPTYVDSQYGYEYKVIETTLTNTEAVGTDVEFRLINVSNGFVTYAFCYGFEVYNDQTGEMVYSKTGSDLYNKNGCGVMGGDWAGSWYVNSGLQFYKSSEGQATSQAGCDGSANNLWGLYYTPSEHGLYAMEYVMKIDNMDAGENVVHIGVNSPAEGTIAGTNKVINASDVEAAGTEGRFAIYTTGIFNYTGSGDGRVEPIVGFYDNASISLTDIRLVKIDPVGVVEDLIDQIGTVTKDSGAAIEAARSAFDELSEEDQASVSNYTTLTTAEAAYAELTKVEPVSTEKTIWRWTQKAVSSAAYTTGVHATYGADVTGYVGTGGGEAENGGAWFIRRDLDTNVETVLGYGVASVVDNCFVHSYYTDLDAAAPNVGDKAIIQAKVYAVQRNQGGDYLNKIPEINTRNLIGLTVNGETAKMYTLAEYDALPAYVDSTYGYEYKIIEVEYTRTEASPASVQTIVNMTSNGGYTDLICYGLSSYKEDGTQIKSINGLDMYNATNVGLLGGGWGSVWYVNSGNVFYASASGKATSQAGCDGTAANMWGLYYPLNQDGNGVYALEYVMKFENITGDNLVKIISNKPAVDGYFAEEVITADKVDEMGGEGVFNIYSLPFVFMGEGDGRVEASIMLYDNADVYLTEVRLVKIEGVSAVEALINAIGALTKDSGTAISTAREAYDALSAEDQALVTNFATLTAAEAAMASVENVETLITAIGTPITINSETAITVARTAFDALTAELQAIVSNTETLTSAEAALAKIKDDMSKANVVIGLINDIGTPITLESKAKIDAARAAYDLLTDDQKTIVNNYTTLTKAEEDYDKLVTYGDINGDKNITAADALLALQFSVKKITLTEAQLKAADVDGKSGVTAADALLILQYSVKKITSFPVQNVK